MKRRIWTVTKGKQYFIILQLFLNVLIIECSITAECHTMLLNGVMLKGLNKLYTDNSNIQVLNGNKLVSDSS